MSGSQTTTPAASSSPEPQVAWTYSGSTSHRESREVGSWAAWSVTSAKPGNGVELLRDGSTETYWQSDGIQPHLINIQFNRRTAVQEVRLYLNYQADESYTPSRLSIRAGSAHHDLKDVCIVELSKPTGWVSIPLLTSPHCDQGAEQPVCAFFYQVAVLANHQNGRDTHIRQIQLYGPSCCQANARSEQQLETVQSSVYSVLR